MAARWILIDTQLQLGGPADESQWNRFQRFIFGCHWSRYRSTNRRDRRGNRAGPGVEWETVENGCL